MLEEKSLLLSGLLGQLRGPSCELGQIFHGFGGVLFHLEQLQFYACHNQFYNEASSQTPKRTKALNSMG